mgnify:CR=1 FL=1
MKHPVLLFLSLAFAIAIIGGCMQTAKENGPGPATGTPMTTVTTVPPSTAITTQPPPGPIPPADPIIGIWRGFNNLPTGRIERIWIFMENGSWTMTNTNVKSQKKKIVLGTWRKEDAGSYQILPRGGAPDTFTYDKENDRFSDSYFRETYSRITGLEDAEREPTMNVTLHSARRVSAIGGSHPYPGNIYLVVNISVKNLNETGWYMFSDENIWIVPDGGTGSASINHKSGDVIENLFPASKILVGEERQGAVIFGVPEQSQSFTLKLFNGMGETISNVLELDNVPLSDEYGSDPA